MIDAEARRREHYAAGFKAGTVIVHALTGERRKVPSAVMQEALENLPSPLASQSGSAPQPQ